MSDVSVIARDTIEDLVAQLLRSVPETWTDYDLTTLSEMRERALVLLTAAEMLERRTTLLVRMLGHPMAVEATISYTGKSGLFEAMQCVLNDVWNDWQEAIQHHINSEMKDMPTSHFEWSSNEKWRLTSQGVIARHDLNVGRQIFVLESILQLAASDGKPQTLPNDSAGQPQYARSHGRLVQIRRVRSDGAPTGVAITNWGEGGRALAAAFADLHKPKPAVAEPAPAPTAGHPSFALLRVFTNGVVDERIEKATAVLMHDKLSANEKLSKIDALIRFPPTASAEQLGEMLGVSKQAVLKTEWWEQNRRGEKGDEIGRRRAGNKERGERYESPRSDGEDKL